MSRSARSTQHHEKGDKKVTSAGGQEESYETLPSRYTRLVKIMDTHKTFMGM